MSSTIAYLDPGSSSSTLELIAVAVGMLVVVTKLFWRRCLGFIQKRDDDENRAASD
jgi:F0F1-type ATP synthase membrane subunit b/b'